MCDSPYPLYVKYTTFKHAGNWQRYISNITTQRPKNSKDTSTKFISFRETQCQSSPVESTVAPTDYKGHPTVCSVVVRRTANLSTDVRIFIASTEKELHTALYSAFITAHNVLHCKKCNAHSKLVESAENMKALCGDEDEALMKTLRRLLQSKNPCFEQFKIALESERYDKNGVYVSCKELEVEY